MPPHSIKQYENVKETIEFTEGWKKRIENAEKAAAKKQQDAMKQQEELQEIGETDVDITTKDLGILSAIDPIRPVMYPIQQILAMICDWLRFLKYVIIWEVSIFHISCLLLGRYFLILLSDTHT